MRRILSMVLAAALALSMLSTAAFAQTGETTTIKVFHTNDSHSRAKEVVDSKTGELTNIGFARFKTFIDSQEADGKLILDAGDTFHGMPFATIENGNSIAKILKAVGYDAISPGNHDFNYGYERLDVLSYRAGVKPLAANVTIGGKNAFDKYLIKNIDGVKVGVFGLATPETAYKTNPKNVAGLDFGDKESLIATAQQMVDELQERDCDVIIALCHLGVDPTSDIKSTDIANAVEGIDLIIDGHSHTELDNYKVGETYGASTGNYLENVGMVTIKVKDGEVLSVEPKLYSAKELKNLPEDSKVKSIVDRIDENQKSILDVVIGKTPITLDGERETNRGGHTNLGRLITSAMLEETGADIALTNGGGIRATIEKGDITKGDVINVLPFGNYIVTKQVKGQDIIDALNFGMDFGAGGFPHFAGMTVEAKKVETTAEDGTTKTKGQVLSILVDGKPIDPNATYTLATNDFMASGGDGYTMLGNYPIENEFSALDEALIRYLSKVGDEGIKAIDAEERLILTDVAKNPALGSGTAATAPSTPSVPDDSDKNNPSTGRGAA